MDNTIRLTLVAGFGGFTGVQDCLNNQYTANAKQSIYASMEQNRKLEEGLLEVYKAYLQEVADNNNGRY